MVVRSCGIMMVIIDCSTCYNRLFDIINTKTLCRHRVRVIDTDIGIEEGPRMRPPLFFGPCIVTSLFEWTATDDNITQSIFSIDRNI